MSIEQVSIRQFRDAIKRLPADETIVDSTVWYRTQKEHWLGWLAGYHTPGGYGRKVFTRDAKFAYNHVVNPQLLIYLIRAIPLRQELVKAAEEAYEKGSSMMQQSGAIRKIAPWEEIYRALWGTGNPPLINRFFRKSAK